MIQPPASNAYYSQDPVRPTQRPTENNDDRPVQRRKENATNCFDMPLGAWLIVIAYTSIISSFCVCAFTVVQILVEVSNRDAGIWPPVAYDYLFYLVIVVNVIFFVASICLCVDGCAGLQCCRLFFFGYGILELLVSLVHMIYCIAYLASPKIRQSADLNPGNIAINCTGIFLYIVYVVALAVFLYQVWCARNLNPTSKEREQNWAIAIRWICENVHAPQPTVYHDYSHRY